MKEHDLNTISQTLHALEAKVIGYQREMDAMTVEAQTEQENCPLEMRSYLVSYLQQIAQRQKDLAQKIVATSAEVNATRDILSAAFVEMKTSETLLDTAKSQLAADRTRKQNAEQADAALRFAVNTPAISV